MLKFFAQLPEAELQHSSFGCFDYEPYGELLRFPVHMIRQRHRQLVAKAYELLERKADGRELVTVKPDLYLAHPSGRGLRWDQRSSRTRDA